MPSSDSQASCSAMEAIFGLIGVLIGGLITWGVELSREGRQDRRAALIGVRLIRSELLTSADVMNVEGQHDAIWRPIWRVAETPARSEHRAAVAALATREEWSIIIAALDNVRIVRAVADHRAAPDRGRAVASRPASSVGLTLG